MGNFLAATDRNKAWTIFDELDLVDPSQPLEIGTPLTLQTEPRGPLPNCIDHSLRHGVEELPHVLAGVAEIVVVNPDPEMLQAQFDLEHAERQF